MLGWGQSIGDCGRFACLGQTNELSYCASCGLDGLSASQVAAELGPGITRNAVIGKINRLGLAERAKQSNAQRPRVAKPPRPVRPHLNGDASRGDLTLAFAPHVPAAPRLAPEEEVLIPISERVELSELRESMCRWPMGDPTTPEFRFCGGKRLRGMRPRSGERQPYCAYHARVAYQPMDDRRRVREERSQSRAALHASIR